MSNGAIPFFPFPHLRRIDLFESTHALAGVCLLLPASQRTRRVASAQGRKDRGEDVTVAAVRGTFGETGYPCERLPLDLIQRALEAGAQDEGRGSACSWERGAVHADVATYQGRGGQVHLVVRNCAMRTRARRQQWRASKVRF
ncbi:hypothetical protein EDB86DRAFT_650579 [Lactarius hatsudake]|nr:hypothetical protein EDB86DRAFT_650579 [Lactarius hatsudake]